MLQVIAWAVCATAPSTMFRTSPVLTDNLEFQQRHFRLSLAGLGLPLSLRQWLSGERCASCCILHFLLRLHHLRLLGLHLFRRHVLFRIPRRCRQNILYPLGGPVGVFPIPRGHIGVADDLRRARNRRSSACTPSRSFFAPCRIGWADRHVRHAAQRSCRSSSRGLEPSSPAC